MYSVVKIPSVGPADKPKYLQGVPAVKVNIRDLVPEQILSQKRHIHIGAIRNSSGVMGF